MNLEQDGIGEPVIIDRSILIPIDDTVYTGKLEMTVSDMITFLEGVAMDQMSREEQSKHVLKVMDIISVKFSPEGIFMGLTDMDNVGWIIQQWNDAFDLWKKNNLTQ